jgi:hypothetical protein
MEFFPANNSLALLLESGANASLRYLHNEMLIAYLAQRIEEAIAQDTNPVRVLEVVPNFITSFDYRLVAGYLWALRVGETAVVNAFEQISAAESMTDKKKLLYKVAQARFSCTTPPGVDGNIVFVSQLEEVFSRLERGLIIYLSDQTVQSSLVTLLDEVAARLSDFIEQQYDLPSTNALVRQGVVKTWVLPDGVTVVSKRENPHKPGWFHAEQFNCKTMLSRMEGQSQDQLLLGRMSDGGVWLKIVRPFAVIRDGYSGQYYALSAWVEGTTLEDLLLNEGNAAMRRVHLTHYRWMLDALYDRGILWGGLAPRNILVQQVGQDLVYHILDFEKMRVLDGPANIAERIVHCREWPCVEELTVICTPTEVEECFRDYFTPATWDLDSRIALPFAPRQEIAALLRGRGLHDITLGAYNQADLELLNVRAQHVDPRTGRRRFPGHLNYKIEHYLSCTDIEHYLNCAGYGDADDYDRKVTEILVSANHHGCFIPVVDVLAQATDRFENACMKGEFEGILEGPSMCRWAPPLYAVDALVHVVDLLYHARECVEDFRHLCDCLILDWRTGLE